MKILISLMILLSISYLYADEEKDLRKENMRIQKLLEQVEENYWKVKYKHIELKQTAKEEIEELENRYSDLMKLRNSLKEEILSLKSDKKDITERIDNYKMRVCEIYSSQMNKVDSLTNFAKRNAPFTTQNDLLRLTAIRNRVENKENFVKIGKEILDFICSKIRDSRESIIVDSDILTKENIPKKGKRIRLGYVFYGYVTDDDKDAGIVLRSSKISKKTFKWHEDISSYKVNLTSLITDIAKKDEFAFLPMDVMQSRAVGKSYIERGSLFKRFLEWFKSGGVVMYGILLVLLYAIFIIIERIIFFRRNHLDADRLMANMLSMIENRDIKGVINICNKTRGSLSRMLRDLFEEEDISREEAHNKMHEVLLHEAPVIDKHLPTLKSLSALAPLLGLLGTVSGMISLFDVITTYGTGDPKLLAGGIAEALVTTEFGLIVAIPAILLHRVLQNAAENIMSDLERFSLTVLNLCWRKG